MTDDTIISVRQARLKRGGAPNTRHGFYSRDLTPEERAEAEALERDFRTRYDLDDGADVLLLRHAIRAHLMALRAVPDSGERATNVYAARTRLFADLVDRLNLSRRERLKRATETDEAAEVAEAIKSMFRPGGSGEMERDLKTGPARAKQLPPPKNRAPKQLPIGHGKRQILPLSPNPAVIAQTWAAKRPIQMTGPPILSAAESARWIGYPTPSPIR